MQYVGKIVAPECAGVIKMANHFIATHVHPINPKFISKRPETNIITVKIAALVFSQLHSLPYEPRVISLKKPILTIVTAETSWYAAAIHTDRMTVITNLGPLQFRGYIEEAISVAQLIALRGRCPFDPSLGLFLQN